MKNHKLSPFGLGFLSVLNILLVLSLAVFSALTLSSAQSDLALSRRAAATVSAYYSGEQSAGQPSVPGETTLPVWDGTTGEWELKP
ncbi:MAG: hypothetical protein RR949_01255 [Oscillospiraceae bacterium]